MCDFAQPRSSALDRGEHLKRASTAKSVTAGEVSALRGTGGGVAARGLSRKKARMEQSDRTEQSDTMELSCRMEQSNRMELLDRTEQSVRMELLDLPQDLLQRCCCHLDQRALASLAQTCRTFQELATSDAPWMRLCERTSAPHGALKLWRRRMDSGKALFRLIHSLEPLIGCWAAENLAPRGGLLYMTWASEAGVDAFRVIPAQFDRSLYCVRNFSIRGQPDGSTRLQLVQGQGAQEAEMPGSLLWHSEQRREFSLEQGTAPSPATASPAAAMGRREDLSTELGRTASTLAVLRGSLGGGGGAESARETIHAVLARVSGGAPEIARQGGALEATRQRGAAGLGLRGLSVVQAAMAGAERDAHAAFIAANVVRLASVDRQDTESLYSLEEEDMGDSFSDMLSEEDEGKDGGAGSGEEDSGADSRDAGADGARKKGKAEVKEESQDAEICEASQGREEEETEPLQASSSLGALSSLSGGIRLGLVTESASPGTNQGLRQRALRFLAGVVGLSPSNTPFNNRNRLSNLNAMDSDPASLSVSRRPGAAAEGAGRAATPEGMESMEGVESMDGMEGMRMAGPVELASRMPQSSRPGGRRGRQIQPAWYSRLDVRTRSRSRPEELVSPLELEESAPSVHSQDSRDGLAAVAAAAAGAAPSGAAEGGEESPHVRMFTGLEGLWTGVYGPHGLEILNVCCQGDEIIARKVTGDPNVPCGEVTFSARISSRSTEKAPQLWRAATTNALAISDDNDGSNEGGPPTAVCMYYGKGRVAEHNFQHPRWVPGKMFVDSAHRISFIWEDYNFMIRLKRLHIEETVPAPTF